MEKRGFRLFGKKKGMRDFCDGLDASKLTLSSLPTLEFDPEVVRKVNEEDDRLVAELKQKYGDDWLEHYVAAMVCDFDTMAKWVNVCIYKGSLVHTLDDPGFDEELARRYKERTRYLYGDMYDKLIHHEKKDRRVAELLVMDAIKTGKWKELPDELQSEYHNRVGGE